GLSQPATTNGPGMPAVALTARLPAAKQLLLQGAKAQIEVEQPLDHQNPHQHQQGQNDPEHGAATPHEALQLLPDVEHHAARSIPLLLLSARSARMPATCCSSTLESSVKRDCSRL